MVDVGVGEQDCPHVAGRETQLTQRRHHIVAVARKAGVDEHDA